MSFKKQVTFFLALFAVSLFPVFAVHAQQASPTVPVQVLENVRTAPVGLALAAMYARAGFDQPSGWEDMICSGMTGGGCDYFESHTADTLWSKSQDVVLSGVYFDQVSATLPDGSQVWKMTLTIFDQDHTNSTLDAYVYVVPDRTQGWLLNRVLYGPYINNN
ncbi:MAG: hypothetical protein WBW94_10950 [Anaerolineales bacterium]